MNIEDVFVNGRFERYLTIRGVNDECYKDLFVQNSNIFEGYLIVTLVKREYMNFVKQGDSFLQNTLFVFREYEDGKVIAKTELVYVERWNDENEVYIKFRMEWYK